MEFLQIFKDYYAHLVFSFVNPSGFGMSEEQVVGDLVGLDCGVSGAAFRVHPFRTPAGCECTAAVSSVCEYYGLV